MVEKKLESESYAVGYIEGRNEQYEEDKKERRKPAFKKIPELSALGHLTLAFFSTLAFFIILFFSMAIIGLEETKGNILAICILVVPIVSTMNIWFYKDLAEGEMNL